MRIMNLGMPHVRAPCLQSLLQHLQVGKPLRQRRMSADRVTQGVVSDLELCCTT